MSIVRNERGPLTIEPFRRIVANHQWEEIDGVAVDATSAHMVCTIYDALSETNKPGILHVKCAVADGEWLFLSSANLTQQAFTINMELGMLVRGGTMPRRVEKQFERLIQLKTLEEL